MPWELMWLTRDSSQEAVEVMELVGVVDVAEAVEDLIEKKEVMEEAALEDTQELNVVVVEAVEVEEAVVVEEAVEVVEAVVVEEVDVKWLNYINSN